MWTLLLILVCIYAVQKLLEFIASLFNLALGVKGLKSENEDLKEKIRVAELKIRLYEVRLRNPFLNPYLNISRNVSKDEIDAVRYAMKCSHPDNGGDAKDFIRFQKVYKELSKQNGGN